MSEGKIFLISLNLLEKFDLQVENLSSVFLAVQKLTSINNRGILESFSASDREKFLELICVNCKNIDDIKNDENIRKIRMSSLLYVYEKHSLNEYKENILRLFDDKKKSILQKIIIPKVYEIDAENEIEILKIIIFEDICFALASKCQDFTMNGEKYNINIPSASCINPNLFTNIFHSILKNTELLFNHDVEFNLKNIFLNVNDIANDIFKKAIEELSNEIAKVETFNANALRKREKMINEREEAMNDKEKAIQSMVQKNLEFSMDLQKKASEIDAKMDELEMKKLETHELMKGITDMCKKILQMNEGN